MAEIRKIAFGDVDRSQHGVRIVQRDDQQPRLIGASRAQHVRSRGITEIHLVAETTDHFHLAWIAFQRGERNAVHAQDATDDLPEIFRSHR